VWSVECGECGECGESNTSKFSVKIAFKPLKRSTRNPHMSTDEFTK